MKRLKRWLLMAALAMLVPPLLWLGSTLAPRLLGTPGASAADQTSTRAYWLEEGKLLRFSLEANRRKLRLYANAALPTGAPAPASNEHYSLRYRVLDEDGVELRAAAYHLRLRNGSEPGLPQRYFTDRAAQPSASNLFFLDLADEPAAATLELTPGSASRPLAGIALRPYYQELRRADRLDRSWDRLHESVRERLAQPNALGLEFLTAAEKRNLVRTRWRPAVPRGIEDEDYAVVQLVEGDVEPLRPAAAPVAERWRLAAGRMASLGLSARTRLLITATGADGLATPGALDVRWHGRLRHERAELAFTPIGNRLEAVAELDRGVVTFEAHRDVWLETVDTERAEPLRPEPNVVRAYDVSSTPVLLPVRHLPAQATPVRLDLRAEAGARATARVDYLVGDAVSASRELSVAAAPTGFELLLQAGERRIVGERQRVYLQVPPEVDTLRVRSTERVWLSAYNRPPDLPRRVLIPESLFGGDTFSQRFPAWFVLAPRDAVERQAGGTTALVEGQLRPPAEAELPSDMMLTERLFPEQDWRGISLLARNDPRRAIAPRGRRASYRRLEIGSQTLELAGAPGAATVTPTLLVRLDGESDGRLRIGAAGKPLVDLALSGRAGRLTLPPVPTGRQRWELEAPSGTLLYLSHVESDDDSYREHSV